MFLLGILFVLIGLLLLVWFIPISSFGFDLDNKSGYNFDKVWLAKHSTNNWKLVTSNLKNGSGIEIPSPNYVYDLRAQYSRGHYEVWTNFDASTKRITVSILPDKRWQAHYE